MKILKDNTISERIEFMRMLAAGQHIPPNYNGPGARVSNVVKKLQREKKSTLFTRRENYNIN